MHARPPLECLSVLSSVLAVMANLSLNYIRPFRVPQGVRPFRVPQGDTKQLRRRDIFEHHTGTTAPASFPATLGSYSGRAGPDF